MTTITVSRPDLSAGDVAAVLTTGLGRRFEVVPSMTSRGFRTEVPGDGHALLVKGTWFERANVRVRPGATDSQVEVTPGATTFGLVRLVDRIGLAHRVFRILEHAPELSGPG